MNTRKVVLTILIAIVIVSLASFLLALWALASTEFSYKAGGILPGCTCDTVQVNLTAGQTVIIKWHSNSTVCVAIGNKQEYTKFDKMLINLTKHYKKQNYAKYCMETISNLLRIFNKTHMCASQGQIVYTAPKTTTYYIIAIPKNYNMSIYTYLRLIIKPSRTSS